MNKIMKKLFRDIRSTIGQFLSIAIVLAVGCFFFAGMLESSFSVERNVDAFYERQNFADMTGVFAAADEWAVAQTAARPGVKSAEGRYYFNTFFLRGGDTRTDANVMTLTEGINLPDLKSGRLPTSDTECLIDERYAAAAGIGLGYPVDLFMPQVRSLRLRTEDGSSDFDKITMEGYKIGYTLPTDPDARFAKLTVTGTYHSPEMIYKMNPQDTSAAADEFAAIMIPYGALSLMTNEVGIFFNDDTQPVYVLDRDAMNLTLYNQIVVDTVNGATLSGVFGGFDAAPVFEFEEGEIKKIAVYSEELSYTRSGDISEKTFRGAFDQIRNLVLLLPMLFFIVAAVITFISLNKMVDIQRGQIGIMQGLGVDKGNVYGIYLLYAVFAAILGAMVGGILGILVLPPIYHMIFASQFWVPAFSFNITPLFLIVGALIAMAVAVLAAFVSCHRTLREQPAQAMRPKTDRGTRGTLIERWKWLWKKLSFGTKMVLRNLLSNKVRVLLSAVGVVGSIMLLTAGFGIKSRVEYVVDYYDDAQNYDLQLVSNSSYEAGEEELLRALDTSKNITGVTLCRTAAATITSDKKSSDSLQLASVPPGSDVILLRKKDGSLIGMKPDSLILPHILAGELGVSAGDTVTVSVTGYGRKQLVVTDVSVQYAMPSVWAGSAVMDELGLSRQASIVYIRSAAPEATKAALEASGTAKIVRTRADVTGRVITSAGLLDMFIVIIVVGAAALAVTVIFNITSINLYERSREIATLMVLGYRRFETSRLIIGENFFITVLGTILGLPAGYGLFRWLVAVVSSLNISLPVTLPVTTFLISIGCVFLFSMVATLLLMRRLIRIDMVEALKSVE